MFAPPKASTFSWPLAALNPGQRGCRHVVVLLLPTDRLGLPPLFLSLLLVGLLKLSLHKQIFKKSRPEGYHREKLHLGADDFQSGRMLGFLPGPCEFVEKLG